MSQEELGLRSGLHRTYIGQIERAEKNVSLKNMFIIANTLNIELRELVDIPELYKEAAMEKGKEQESTEEKEQED